MNASLLVRLALARFSVGLISRLKLSVADDLQGQMITTTSTQKLVFDEADGNPSDSGTCHRPLARSAAHWCRAQLKLPDVTA